MSRRHPSGYIRPGYNPLEVADAPTSPGASAGNESASVSFTAPADEGGSSITNYYAVSSPGGITSSSVTSPIAVSGLTNGTEYTFKVWGENSYGPSPYSDSTGAVTPAPLFIEDVFSTYLYTGNSSTQTITNGVDLDGEGGLVWIKARTSPYGAASNVLVDTERGASNMLFSNLTDATLSNSTYVTSFNSNGFSVGDNSSVTKGETNLTSGTYASWTFRKAPKFFDVVTYTGNGTSPRAISHNLGSTPGCIIVKATSVSGENWTVYHRGIAADAETDGIYLNTTGAAIDESGFWNDTAPTSTNFTVGANLNSGFGSGVTYVAYLFAHDAGGFGDAGDENVISCGSFTYSAGTAVNLNYEPQMVLIKSVAAGGWYLVDNIRGWTTDGNGPLLSPNTSAAETAVGAVGIAPTSTGFVVPSGYGNGNTYIYIAIRRGPMKTPTDGTSVFAPVAYAGNDSSGRVISGFGFPNDMAITKSRTNANNNFVIDRLRGWDDDSMGILKTNTTSAEAYDETNRFIAMDYMDGFEVGSDSDANASGQNYISWGFRRAPGFFDVVCYTGTGSAQNVSHNLTVAPEFMVIKRRNNAYAWIVYSQTLGATKYLELNGTRAEDVWPEAFNNTEPTSTVFTVNTAYAVNESAGTYVAYLFASCPGVSKVGSYTGTGTTLQVDCGFSAGARFVLIKRTDSTGDWYVWDSARGIVAGDDPYLLLNSSAAQVSNTDYVDTYSAGFEITSTAPAAINASGGTYIYLAIA